MIRKLFLVVVLLVLLASAAAAAGAYWAWQKLHAPFPEGQSVERRIEVESGTGARAILELLQDEGVLWNADLTRLYLTRVLEDPSLKAGEYRFDEPLSAPEVLDKLIAGKVVTYPLTVIEGLTFDETAQAIAEAGFGDLDRLMELVSSPEWVLDLYPDAETLEGFLLPDTYSFARNTSEETIVRTMVESFRERALPIAEQSERPLVELIKLASIVEKEARLEEERPIIAGVYANRLRIGMALYADPTIIYGLKRRGIWDGNLKRSHLEEQAPYNSYLVPGLPPTPICSPGLQSIAAAASPADVPYLYFVSRNDGSHVFAKTLREHNRNVEEWQRRYWRERR